MGQVKILREPPATELKRNKWAIDQLRVAGFRGRRFQPPPAVPYGLDRRLHEFDPALALWFNRVISRWQLYWNGEKVLTFQNPDGSFARPDPTILDVLRRADSRTRGDAPTDEIVEHNQKLIESDERDFRNKVADVTSEVAKGVAKKAEEDIGAINVPKEDLEVPDEEELEKRRKARKHPKNYRRRPMPFIELEHEMKTFQGMGI